LCFPFGCDKRKLREKTPIAILLSKSLTARLQRVVDGQRLQQPLENVKRFAHQYFP
jgi:hypothetical protein